MAVQISGNDITVPRDGSFTRNVTIGGTLTYEDVTNIDSVGLVTARNGIVVGSGITLSKDGDGFFTGVTTATTFSGNLSGGTVSGTTGTFSGAISGTTGTFTSSLTINTTTDQMLNLNSTDDGGTYIGYQRSGTRTAYLGHGGTGGTFSLRNEIQDGYVTITGNDGGSYIDMISLATSSNGDATFSGNLIIPDKIVHSGDTDTAIRFSGADTISIETGGVTRATVTGNNIDLPDAGTLRFGASNDLQIYHGTGGASNIIHSNTSQPLIINASGAGAIRLDTNSTERLRINSDGDVGIGIDSPAATVHISKSYTAPTGGIDSNTCLLLTNSGASAYAGLAIQGTTSGGSYIHFGDTDDINVGNILYDHPTNSMQFYANASEKMRILSGGLCVGRTSTTSYTAALHVSATGGGGIAIATHADTTCMYFNRTDNNAAYVAMRFYTQGGQRGYIQVNTGSTTYSTSGSDIRLKKDIEDWTEEVLPYFKSLKPQKFRFNSEDETVEKTKGYMAQDNLDKFPEAYPLNSEDDRYWFAPQHMIPYLMKALQEEIVKREEIEAKYNALEARLDAAGL